MREIDKNQRNKLKAIGKRLKELRMEKGYTSYDLFAWENKLPRTSYFRMEQGQNFYMATFIKLLGSHEMTFQEFFKRTGI